jgi:hypothetical protein
MCVPLPRPCMYAHPLHTPLTIKKYVHPRKNEPDRVRRRCPPLPSPLPLPSPDPVTKVLHSSSDVPTTFRFQKKKGRRQARYSYGPTSGSNRERNGPVIEAAERRKRFPLFLPPIQTAQHPPISIPPPIIYGTTNPWKPPGQLPVPLRRKGDSNPLPSVSSRRRRRR